MGSAPPRLARARWVPWVPQAPSSLQVVNGLMERPDWKEAMKKPLCILPGGSGNALAASINYYAG